MFRQTDLLDLDRAAPAPAAGDLVGDTSQEATCSSSRSFSKSRTMKRSSISAQLPLTEHGVDELLATLPAVSGERRSCGRRERISSASLIAFTSSPFAQPGVDRSAADPHATCAPENVSLCSSPRSSKPSTVGARPLLQLSTGVADDAAADFLVGVERDLQNPDLRMRRPGWTTAAMISATWPRRSAISPPS